MNFKARIQPAKKANIIEDENYFIWCASAVKHEDKYHLFASRWKRCDGFESWSMSSSIVRLEATNIEGPYVLKEELYSLKTQAWCNKMVHNPTVCKINDKYYLYYVGTTYQANENSLDNKIAARFHQCIGVAVSETPEGPWVPSKQNPILAPSDNGGWDSTYVTNPSVVMSDAGEIALFYKSRLEKENALHQTLCLGVAFSQNPTGPFERRRISPIFEYNVEDPFVWKENGLYWMIAKDMAGVFVARKDGVLFVSENLEDWNVAENHHAYDRNVFFDDGEVKQYDRMERAQLLMVDDEPIAIFMAVKSSKDTSFNLVRCLGDRIF